MAKAIKTKQKGANNAQFTTGSTMRHVMVMSATGAIGLVALFLVDVANLFYISLLGQKELAAAIGYASTIVFFAVSVCIGFSIAATAITARAIGEGELKKSKSFAGSSMILTFVVSVILTLLLLFSLEWLLSKLGATGETHQIAVHFMQISVPSIPLLGLGMCCAGLLRAIGDAKRAMYVTLSSGIAAAIIDPILIFYFDLGITGAAISVVIVRLLLVLIGLHGTLIVHQMVTFPTLSEFKNALQPFFHIGGPAVMTQIATPVGNAYVTGTIAGFGDDAVAGWAIVGRIIPLAFAGIFALSGAVGPILAQNYGAGKIDRVVTAMRDSLIFTFAYVAIMWIALASLSGVIANAFGASGDSARMIEVFCYYAAGLQIFTGFLFVANAAFNNLDHAFLSTIFNWGRATLGVIPFVFLAKEWGPQGVVIGWALGGAIFGILSIIACYKVLQRLPDQAKKDGITVHVPAVANSPFSSGRGAGLG